MRRREVKFRHELKYYINYSDYHMLSHKLRAVLPSDPNVGESGEYFIRSLYFDDLEDSGLREKLAGVDNRDKYRVRIYNLSPELIKLERKRKVSGYISKESVNLTQDEFYMLASGEYGFLYDSDDAFSRAMYLEFVTRRLTPKVIVDYKREPYVFPYQDVRITFDKQIKTAYRATDLFNPQLPTYPVLGSSDMVLEIKFNNTLPTYIWMLLQSSAVLRSAVSKYVICRKYEL